MSLLLPLGLLGLLSIIVLIIIYLIRPNYQQKYVSSTFVWRLSLKYRRKKLPTSKLRNILLILCQVLILALASMILAKPVHMFFAENADNEVIAIIDSSATMRTETAGETRYERAVSKVKDLANTTFGQGGLVSVILADRSASFLVERVDSTNEGSLDSSLNDLIGNGSGEINCSYGTADIDSAVTLCEDVLADNPNARIYLYTDVEYAYVPEAINIVDVSETTEWNAAILNAYVEMNDNYYDIIVDVAVYGMDNMIGINVEVSGVNISDTNPYGDVYKYNGSDYQVFCTNDVTKRVVFKCGGINEIPGTNTEYFDIDSQKFYSFSTINVYLDEDDSYELDDNYTIYGGTKETIRVQYASPKPNTFFSSAFYTFTNVLRNYYNIEFVESKDGNPALEGFDYYIFEENLPTTLPTDGIVLIENPDISPTNGGFTVGSVVSNDRIPLPLTAENEDHALMKNVMADKIEVTKYTKLSRYDESYEVLMSCDNSPILMVKNEGTSKIVLMNLDVHYSNITIRNDFLFILINMFDYFFPTLVDSNSAEVYDTVTLNSRGSELTVTKDQLVTTYTSFPASFIASVPGTYEIMQESVYGKQYTENIYVSIPVTECNINELKDTITDPYANRVNISMYDDFMFYFAIALVAFIFLEWWLKNRDNA